jgi:hypothetical protein
MGIEWVLPAVDNLRKDDKFATEPGWYSAAKLVADQPLFRNALLRTLDMDPKQRDMRLPHGEAAYSIAASGASVLDSQMPASET